jgi:hypothetical protein
MSLPNFTPSTGAALGWLPRMAMRHLAPAAAAHPHPWVGRTPTKCSTAQQQQLRGSGSGTSSEQAALLEDQQQDQQHMMALRMRLLLMPLLLLLGRAAIIGSIKMPPRSNRTSNRSRYALASLALADRKQQTGVAQHES